MKLSSKAVFYAHTGEAAHNLKQVKHPGSLPKGKQSGSGHQLEQCGTTSILILTIKLAGPVSTTKMSICTFLVSRFLTRMYIA